MKINNALKTILCAGTFYMVQLPASGQGIGIQNSQNTEIPSINAAILTSPTYKPGTIRHIVLFKYADTVNMMQRDRIKRRFLHLKQSPRADGNPYITSIETGSQNSNEGLSAGFEQAFIVTFKSEGDRNYYAGAPAVNESPYFDKQHAAFKDFVGPFLAKESAVLVFDYSVTR